MLIEWLSIDSHSEGDNKYLNNKSFFNNDHHSNKLEFLTKPGHLNLLLP